MTEDDLDKVSTPRGNGRSMTALKPSYDMNISYGYGYPSVAPGQGQDWFGPLAPMHPVAPPEVAGRTWDFVPGFNLATEPRAYEPVKFETLRMLAQAYDPLTLVIEKRKDQLSRMAWTIRPRHEGCGKPPSSSQLSSQTRGIIKDVTEFFKYPTEGISFRSWLRMVVDDLLILDAPSIYMERDPGGNLVALSPTDGATIKRIIDDRGRTPRPFRWDGQPFVWLGETVNLANYTDLGFKIANGLMYAPAYQQILKGLPAVNLTSWDLCYKPMNLRTRGVYGYSPVEMVMTSISIAMRRSISQLEYYREGNQPDAIYGLPETFGPDQIQRLQDWWDNVHAGNLGARRKMKFLPGGTNSNYVPLKEPALKGELDEWLTRIVCAAFSYPPSCFVSLSNRSIAESHERQAEEEGLEPLKVWFCELANEIVEREFDDSVEFAWTEEQEIEPEKQKDILTGYAESGVLTLNQVRNKIGEEPDPDPAANKLMVRTQTGYIPIGGGTKGKGDDDNESA
jgi:Phage portal protein